MKSPANLQELRALSSQGVPLRYRFFLDYQPSRNGLINQACLSQWWPCLFTLEGRTFSTTEHYMMHEKARLFGDGTMAARIIETSHPFEAKMLGRRVQGYDEARWNAVRFEIVVRGNIAKFSQNPKPLAYLLSTGDDILAEASPTDLIWGTGCGEDDPLALQPGKWPGQSLLGFALMQAREHLKIGVALPAPSMA